MENKQPDQCYHFTCDVRMCYDRIFSTDDEGKLYDEVSCEDHARHLPTHANAGMPEGTKRTSCQSTGTQCRNHSEPEHESVATLTIELYVHCPHCAYYFDLIEQEQDNQFVSAICSNKWNQVSGIDVTCPECEQDFNLKGVEW